MLSIKGDIERIGGEYGCFTVENGKITVSDAHNYDGLERADVKAKNGRWVCYRYSKDGCTTAILAAHEDLCPYLKEQGVFNSCIWDMKQIGKVDVDSGMAGFFSESTDGWTECEWKYAVDCIVKNGCLKTDSGFFSSTFGGDGIYPVYAWMGEGERAVGLCINYGYY